MGTWRGSENNRHILTNADSKKGGKKRTPRSHWTAKRICNSRCSYFDRCKVYGLQPMSKKIAKGKCAVKEMERLMQKQNIKLLAAGGQEDVRRALINNMLLLDMRADLQNTVEARSRALHWSIEYYKVFYGGKKRHKRTSQFQNRVKLRNAGDLFARMNTQNRTS